MKPGMAIDYFSRTPLEGYDPSSDSWVPDISRGDFLTFDRFITERTFGQKKRMFVTGERGLGDLPLYDVVRAPDGEVYIVAAKNVDFDGFEGSRTYANVYLLLRAEYQAEVIRVDSQTNAAGVEVGRTDTVVGTYYCDIERFSNKSGSEIDDIVFSQFTITLPKYAEGSISVDNEIRVDGILYDVKEVDRLLNTVELKAMKRGGR